MASSPPRPSLPDDVREALERGNVIEAIKRLRASGKIGLKDARDRIAQERMHPTARAPAAAAPRPAAPPGMQGPLPPAIGQAIAAGRKIEAIRLYREHMGTGLKESREAVEKLEREHALANPMLAPGQVPPGNEKVWLAVLGGLLLLAAYFFFW